MYPFNQKKKGKYLIREFSKDVSSEELVWHRDKKDRIVRVMRGKDWYLQMDNQIPKKLLEGKTYYIPAYNYHRLIKGSDKLVVEIEEKL